MKTKIHLILAIALFSMTSCVTRTRVVTVPAQTRVVTVPVQTVPAQTRVTVEATDYDISYNLDLEAVATLFGNVNSLEEFERRLNDYSSRISNLDLNYDGRIDYLRVVETFDRNANVVVIQAVLDMNIYQDVATIVVEKANLNRTYVQIIGSPYLYGRNYIIEPVYSWQPPIYTVFRNSYYVAWHSPYYWGYYPTYYHYVRPVAVNVYIRNIHTCINYQHRYHYTSTVRYQQGITMHTTISRNDYGTKYPERTFTQRNNNMSNSYELRSSRDASSSSVRGTTTVSGSGSSSQRNTSTVNSSNSSAGSTRSNSGTQSSVNSTSSSSRNSAAGTTSSSSVNSSTNSSSRNSSATSTTNSSSRNSSTAPATNSSSRNSSTAPATNSSSRNSSAAPATNSSSRNNSSTGSSSNASSSRNSNSGTNIDSSNNSSRSSGTSSSSSSSNTNSSSRNSGSSGSSSRR